MALSERDRDLLARCLAHENRAWREFVDRFVGLVIQVIDHSAQARACDLSRQDRDDLVAEVFAALVQNDFRILRRFRGASSLATYLTVVSRRIVVREMLRQRKARRRPSRPSSGSSSIHPSAADDDFRRHFENTDLVRHLLEQLNDRDSRLVQLYYLQGLSYAQIANQLDLPENSIGPTLSRARSKMMQWLASADVTLTEPS